MIKRNKTIVFIMLALMLVGCRQQTEKVKDFSDTPVIFEVDASTMKNNIRQNLSDSENLMADKINQEGIREETEQTENIETNTPSEYEQQISVGQINITNDADIQYEIVDNNIVFNNITYHDLYLNASSLEMPYEVDKFIKFILTYYPTSEDVYTSVLRNVTAEEIAAMEAESEVGEYIGADIDEEFLENTKYVELCNQFGESATWRLEVYNYGGANKGTLLGNKQFVLITGTSNNIEIDLSEM